MRVRFSLAVLLIGLTLTLHRSDPEPGTLTLLVIGLLALTLTRRAGA